MFPSFLPQSHSLLSRVASQNQIEQTLIVVAVTTEAEEIPQRQGRFVRTKVVFLNCSGGCSFGKDLLRLDQAGLRKSWRRSTVRGKRHK
jgi:hypothetical protein